MVHVERAASEVTDHSWYTRAPISVATTSAGRAPIINGMTVRTGKRPNEHHVMSPRVTMNHHASDAMKAVSDRRRSAVGSRRTARGSRSPLELFQRQVDEAASFPTLPRRSTNAHG